MALWHTAMAALERRVMRAVEQIPSRMIGWTLSSKSSAIGDDDEVETGDGDDSQRPVRRTEPFGVRSRAPSKIRTLQLRIGSSNVFFLGVASTNGYGPTDLEDGETALYSAEVERGVHLTKDGDTKLAAKSGQTVQVNGDDYAMSKWGSAFFEDFVAYMTVVDTLLKTLVPGTGATGTVAYANATALPTSLINKMLVSSNYVSSKAKNG